MRASSARIAGNTITDNTAGNGIAVDKVSQADIAGNLINKNAMNGISVSGNSGVTLGMDKAGTPFDLPNYTDAGSKNSGAGIACTTGGYVTGYKGFVAGVKGALIMDASCVNGIQASPYTVVGTWTVTTTPSDSKTAAQIAVRADGTGTALLVNSTTRAFTWTLTGDQFTITTTGANVISRGPLTFEDSNNATWVFTATDKQNVHTYQLHRKGTPLAP
jgi:hypothetical protein